MSFTVMFYNLENLYDVKDDARTNDDEFTPQGAKRWTEARYRCKLENLSEVISAAAKSNGGFPAVIGVSEVENIKVMRDLAACRRVSGAGYKALLYESKDARGVDVGMFYSPSIYQLEGSEPVKLVLRSGRDYVGRDILATWGKIGNEMFAIYVCHFLSRRAGVNASAGFRRAGAETVRDHAVRLREKYPNIKVIIMGDINDCPCDDSLALLLKAGKSPYKVKEGEYFNPFWQLYEEGQGSSLHNHSWVLYDNIVVSHNLLPNIGGNDGIKISRIDQRHWGQIFKKNFMMEKGAPKRCYHGNTFVNGYSDHLPVIIKLT